MENISVEKLMIEAKKASEYSYSPYSHFTVGAALLCADGEIVTAANVENRSYGLTICAERSAVVKAISLGKTDYKALAIYCGKADYPVSPCGACRQVISEFADGSMPVYFSGVDINNRVETTVAELFPFDALSEMKNGRYEE
ncbi:MAG: cytidine deaminase [Spirochaetales bacterium]|uniref:Cytidine deaminase n=1 Tax=Candidatus Thalassospirochaeta sargassi TaxID=3119039 RepID=A0AAJ1MKG3_9SPIO|nr:cytidine deaminase [Spirochaetales bacterium]